MLDAFRTSTAHASSANKFALAMRRRVLSESFPNFASSCRATTRRPQSSALAISRSSIDEHLVERRGCQHLVEPTLDVGRRGIPDPLTRGLRHVPELLPELTKECLAESGEVAFDSPLLLKLIP